jgi:hypothetical protein
VDIFIQLYPIMVAQSRYGGLREGGAWHALPNADAAWAWSDAYFEYMFGDDDQAINFWHSSAASKVGRGDTPNAAVMDLVERHTGMRQWECDDTSRTAEAGAEKESQPEDNQTDSEATGLLP